MSGLPFVDTHIHFYDFSHPELRWTWLEPDAVNPPQLPGLDAIKAQVYRLEHLIAESRFCNVEKAVHVQAALGSADPVVETQWLQQMATTHSFVLGIVAYSNLKSTNVLDELSRHCESPAIRGIRDFSEGDYLVDPAFQRGYALLEDFDLSFDLDCTWENMVKARDLAHSFPNTVLILDHAGFPQERSSEYFTAWKRGMLSLAEADNAVCKISGLGMTDPQWTVQSLRPWVLQCIEAFGVERCFFGTNWPVDRLFSSYTDLINAYREIISDFSRDEQHSLLAGNAERYYRL